MRPLHPSGISVEKLMKCKVFHYQLLLVRASALITVYNLSFPFKHQINNLTLFSLLISSEKLSTIFIIKSITKKNFYTANERICLTLFVETIYIYIKSATPGFRYSLYVSDLAMMSKLRSYVGVLKFSTRCSERRDTTLRLIAIVFQDGSAIIIHVMYYRKNNEEKNLS